MRSIEDFRNLASPVARDEFIVETLCEIRDLLAEMTSGIKNSHGFSQITPPVAVAAPFSTDSTTLAPNTLPFRKGGKP